MSTPEKEKIFSEILEENRQLLSKVCYMYAEDEDSFKDLFQEVIINLWQGLDKFRGDCKWSTWIYRLAFNTCVSYRRSTARHSGNLPIEAAGEVLCEDPQKAENLKMMYDLISGLNPFDKAIIMMWLDEKSYDEISDVCGLTRNGVATRLHRIKARLVEMGKINI